MYSKSYNNLKKCCGKTPHVYTNVNYSKFVVVCSNFKHNLHGEEGTLEAACKSWNEAKT